MDNSMLDYLEVAFRAESYLGMAAPPQFVGTLGSLSRTRDTAVIESDPRLKKITADVAERSQLPVTKWIEETRRLAQNIPRVRLGHPSSMEESRLQLSSHRSRLVGIKFDLLRERAVLAGIHQDMKDYLYARYHQFLLGVKTERARSAIVNKALQPLTKRLRPIDAALELVELVMSDYDSRGFAFRDLVAATRRGDRPE